jgi:predicted nucleic acid-binding protein
MMVDSSAWVEFLRATGSREHLRIKKALNERTPLLLCTTVLQEVLQGAHNATDMLRLEQGLSHLVRVEPANLFAQARLAAHLYAQCRWSGFTLRSAGDCMIAALAIELNQPVLHRDRDFDHIAAVDLRLKFV